jgi:hypothetical protein
MIKADEQIPEVTYFQSKSSYHVVCFQTTATTTTTTITTTTHERTHTYTYNKTSLIQSNWGRGGLN